MRNRIIIPIVLAATILFGAPTAEAGDIAWDKLIGAKVSKLTAEQKQQVEAALTGIQNTRGCEGTLAECLAKGDLTARRHAGFVARMVRKGKDKAFIEAGVKKRHQSAFPDEVFKVNLKDRPQMGPDGAKVVITEYACFECPFCAHLAPKLKKLHKKFGNKLSRHFKYYPVRSHKRGVPSALAAIAAHRQGKFWEMHDKMFAHRTDLEDADLESYAVSTGLDLAQFKLAMKDKAAMKVIEKDKLEGMRFGIEGTPTFFVNGKMFLGLAEMPEIIDRIEEELDIVEGRIK